jgi:uncharacterized protein involved in type VI secretion and phage assembly
MARVTDRHGRAVSGQMPGLVEAIVVDNVDPERLGRVRVRYPSLPDEPESYWARLVMPMAGRNRGWMTIPEIGDEVLVSFMHGDITHAIVVGSLYNGVDRPPYANEDEQNNLRVFQSRSGHRVTFDDTQGAERIELVTHNQEIRVEWDAANKVLAVYCGGDIVVQAKDHIDVSCTTFSLTATEAVEIGAANSMVIDAGALAGVLAGSQVQITAPDVRIN